jgi:GWxTD domain-containing protein
MVVTSLQRQVLPRFSIVVLGALVLSLAPILSSASSLKSIPDDSSPFQSWLDEDVAYIIATAERAAFLQLSTDEERSQFIEQFWLRRDPTPDTAENEFKQEHYRRIVYANEHFGAIIPGWKSDRGRVYIIWGTPDQIDSDSDCVKTSKLTAKLGKVLAACPPHEVWHYNYIDGIGANEDLTFVDITRSGNLRLVWDSTEENLILNPYGELAAYRQAIAAETEHLKSHLSDLELPTVKFKALEEAITTGIGRYELPFTYRSDSIRATKFTMIVPIIIEVPDREFNFHDEEGIATARINLLGRIIAADGTVADTFENSIVRKLPEIPGDSGQTKIPIYQYMALLRPGGYQLEIVVQDVASGKVGMINTALRVSTFENSHVGAL